SIVTIKDHSVPAKLSSGRLYVKSIRMLRARPRPNDESRSTKSLLAKSGVDDQDQSNQTAVRPNAAALTTTRILNDLTFSRSSLTAGALRMPIPDHLESASAFRF